nr:photosystem I PsaA/PsaB [Tanacetum cinerariifolium]
MSPSQQLELVLGRLWLYERKLAVEKSLSLPVPGHRRPPERKETGLLSAAKLICARESHVPISHPGKPTLLQEELCYAPSIPIERKSCLVIPRLQHVRSLTPRVAAAVSRTDRRLTCTGRLHAGRKATSHASVCGSRSYTLIALCGRVLWGIVRLLGSAASTRSNATAGLGSFRACRRRELTVTYVRVFGRLNAVWLAEADNLSILAATAAERSLCSRIRLRSAIAPRSLSLRTPAHFQLGSLLARLALARNSQLTSPTQRREVVYLLSSNMPTAFRSLTQDSLVYLLASAIPHLSFQGSPQSGSKRTLIHESGLEELEGIGFNPATDKFIKSSVENLIPIPSESEGIPDNICDVPFHDNSPPLDVSKDQFEDFSDSNNEFSSTDDDSFSIDNIEYVEASSPDTVQYNTRQWNVMG